MEQNTIHVLGMSCGHCVRSVEESVSTMNGVESVAVVLDEGKVDVAFDANVVSLQGIIDMIEEQGYAVK